MKRFAALLLVACADKTLPSVPAVAPAVDAGAPPVHAATSTWAVETRSPRAVEASAIPAGRAAELLSACGEPDAALMAFAAAWATSSSPVSEFEAPLRERGSPFLRPRSLIAEPEDEPNAGNPNYNPDDPDAHAKSMLKNLRVPSTRCGVAVEGRDAYIVMADALADLDPLPVRARTGAWLHFDATVHVPATEAKVIVHRPRGAPKTYPTTIDAKGRAHATFVLDAPGAFTVQLIARLEEGGPRPLLEAKVFADVAPSHDLEKAPGERETSLEAMVAAARKEDGLPPLKRDPRLDALASAHVEAMHKAGRIAHDLGDSGSGDLTQRFQAEGYVADIIGENVARAETLPLAHRKLYASPSHRLNLLNAQYTRLGVATFTEGTRIWVCEVFSSDLR